MKHTKWIHFLYVGVLLMILSLSTACETIKKVASNLPNGSTEPSDTEIGNGLKEALNDGISKGVSLLSQTDGYFKDELIKIFLPPEAKKVENIMRKYIPGGKSLVEDAILKMNRAAEDAAQEAKPIFVDAIKSMTIKDARNILFGADSAATNYLRDKTYSSLTNAYSPKINSSLDKVGAVQAWSALITQYNKFANSAAAKVVKGAEPIEPNLGAYVTQKALDGLFFKVKGQEQKIRGDISERKSALLQKVFGLLDK